MKIVFCWLFFMVSFAALFSQDVHKLQDAPRRARKSFEKAEAYVKAGLLPEAQKELERVTEIDPLLLEALVMRADVEHDLKQYDTAIAHYYQALELDPDFDNRIWYRLARTLQKDGRYQDAVDAYEHYLDSGERSKRMIAMARKYLDAARFAADAVRNPVPFAPERLGARINTPRSEYLPSFSADESLLIFTRVVNNQEDFFYCTKIGDSWSQAREVIGVNTRENEGAQSISADGRTLVFTACNRRGGLGSCDLYIASRKRDSWSPARNLGSNVNSAAWDSQPSLSANGKFLFFASNRKGGQGGSDIYVCVRRENGTWSPPRNLGDAVNTPQDDQAPFIHGDGRTLYFMSKGHRGMGGFDLFVSRLQADGSWSTPNNLGYPINTTGNEGALVVSLDGKTAYFSSDIDSTGENVLETTDIFRFALYEEARPSAVTYVKATVVDANTDEPLEAHVELRALNNGFTYYEDNTNDDGSFLVTLPQGENYALNVDKEGYLFHSEYFELEQQGTLADPYLLEIRLQPVVRIAEIEKSEPVILKNVFFETGSAALRPSSREELQRLYELLRKNRRMYIQINGHTDNVGKPANNQDLSTARAKAVYDYLVEAGIDRERLSFKGFGESQPIDTNDTARGRQRNRRTEFQVVYPDY